MFANTNEDKNNILKNIDCFALDMDGTIYLDDHWIDGAKDFLKKIEASGRKYIFLTNNSSKNPKNYVDKLHKMGLDVDLDKIVTSGQATVYYLQQNYPGKKVFLLGNDLLKEEFEEGGILLDDKTPDMVVTAFDTSLNYEKMCKVCDFVRAGLPYIATHPDYNCPTKTGFIPDAGAIHAFINASAFRNPDRIIGKPNTDIIKYLLSRLHTSADKVIMVGDRLYTDIAAGKNNGLYSMLVLSGETKLEDVESSEVKPHLIFDSVKEVIPLL
ncbi:HAD-IIA family hydrolase [Pectinatus haikarae]|uniref:Acid sugar phosphatase n=1 Tax=Pectinatus haikarae TaxID=349096 RepID=A0ABT9Y9V0_9FIRM|nr:HAD-IIA family hydrolase [Pectinatus haikarae]MDQ0204621.1 HAD superfamily hydrolase (TIGR01457 family) [Pectinatus haikarae]